MGLYYLYNDGTTEFSFKLYVNWFPEFVKNDAVLPSTVHGELAPTASVAISAYIETSFDDLGRRLPTVRPLGLHVLARYSPNSTSTGSGASDLQHKQLLSDESGHCSALPRTMFLKQNHTISLGV